MFYFSLRVREIQPCANDEAWLASGVSETDSPWQTIRASKHIKAGLHPISEERLKSHPESKITLGKLHFFFLPALKKSSGKKKICFTGDAVEETSVLKIQHNKAFALLSRSIASSTGTDQ